MSRSISVAIRDNRHSVYLMAPAGSLSTRPAPSGPPSISDIQVLHVKGVLLDELAARLDLVTHQPREPEVGGGRVLDVHADDHPPARVHCRLPELRRVHLAEALEARNLDPALGERQRRLAQALE